MSFAQAKEIYDQGKLILFVGAGVSANLGLPSWSQLIRKISIELNYDPDVFSTYGNYLALAEFYRLRTGSIGPLRSWMDREWHRADIAIGDSKIHEHIARGNFSRIYTTNYDRWLEYAHDAYDVHYQKIASAADLVNTKDSERQIVKLHGDFDDDSSIVLDETSYFERLNFESPLDLKIRSDTLARSVLFIGYSISDINIRLLFYRLTKMWEQTGKHTARPISYVFNHRPNPVDTEVLKQWGIDMISSDEDDPGAALEKFLGALCA